MNQAAEMGIIDAKYAERDGEGQDDKSMLQSGTVEQSVEDLTTADMVGVSESQEADEAEGEQESQQNKQRSKESKEIKDSQNKKKESSNMNKEKNDQKVETNEDKN